MKYLILACLFVSATAEAQILTRNQVNSTLTASTSAADAQTIQAGNLVSEYTFRKLVRDNFSLLLTGEENKTKVGRYASLEVDKDEKSVSVSPITWSQGNNPLHAPFHWVASLDLQASVNGKGIFDWEDRQKVKAGVSILWANGIFSFYNQPVANRRQKPANSVYVRAHSRLQLDLLDAYDDLGTNIVDSISSSDNYSSVEKLQKAYFDKVAEVETTLTDEIWNAKTFYWFKINLTPISYDIFDVVSKADTASYVKPIDNEVYNPSIEFSANFYRVSKRWISWYVSGWIKATQKHTLSEIGSTEVWNKISSLGDSSFVVTDTKDVYFLDDGTIRKKALTDYGFEVIALLPERALNAFTLGLNATYSSLGILSKTDNDDRAEIRKWSIGIILPLKDKEGKNTVNIVPFFERKKYVDYNKGDEDVWGVKFSLPFKNYLN